MREEEEWRTSPSPSWRTLKREETKPTIAVKATAIPIINLTTKMDMKMPIASIKSVRKVKAIAVVTKKTRN